jgi:tRNA-specific 2-thiouridylase
VDEQGKTIGEHDGFWRFTPGQRKGIGVSASTPLYVLDANAATNAVIVGPHDSLARRRVAASGRLYVDVDRAAAKLRYRSPAVSATVSQSPGGFTLELDEPAYGVARGQAAVLYEGDAVVGCGLISTTADI